MRTSRGLRIWIVSLAATWLVGMVASASAPVGAATQATITPEPPGGAALYLERCAACHGASGSGDGPMAHMLRHEPPDLTRLAERNHGRFPSARVYRVIEGRDVESHGSREMPIWGDVFKVRRNGASHDTARARIDAIVLYLESIQRRETE